MERSLTGPLLLNANSWLDSDQKERPVLEHNPDPETHNAILAHRNITRGGKWSAPSAAFKKWLADHGVPAEISGLLHLGLPAKEAQYGFRSVLSPAQIIKADSMDPKLLAARLLQIGASGGGDPIVIDLEGPLASAVAFLSHERYWESESSSPREALRYVACDWTAFLICIAKDAIPIDSFPSWSESNTEGSWQYSDPTDDE